jgi:glycosyltransferase involved in cell wall biosynthesis
MTLPRAVALLPTYNRPEMAHRAVHLFLAQDYDGDKMIIVFDDGDVPVTLCGDCIRSNQVVIRSHARMTLPAKRNAMMQFVGDHDAIYFLWDDDDYHGPNRVRRQVAALGRSEQQACLLRPTLYFNSISNELAVSSWVSDGTVAYTWEFWKRRTFNEYVDPGSGFQFVYRAPLVEIPGELDYMVVVHQGQRHTPPAFGPPEFSPAPIGATWATEHLVLPEVH